MRLRSGLSRGGLSRLRDTAMLAFSYDDVARTVTARNAFADGGVETLQTLYDDAGNWTSIVLPNGSTITRSISRTRRVCAP